MVGDGETRSAGPSAGVLFSPEETEVGDGAGGADRGSGAGLPLPGFAEGEGLGVGRE